MSHSIPLEEAQNEPKSGAAGLLAELTEQTLQRLQKKEMADDVGT